ncbi:arca-like protein [Ophiostoma piceae UAMH 11346]|uniref:Arca-like protein n=1 Tax=Ophiostoma piceae (strain UAMH 11346) TaxID=1262450 RepID=S3D657_OPHP1|nr:arca-like protein [Ophiostoma piceae UAMH 11346]
MRIQTRIASADPVICPLTESINVMAEGHSVAGKSQAQKPLPQRTKHGCQAMIANPRAPRAYRKTRHASVNVPPSFGMGGIPHENREMLSLYETLPDDEHHELQPTLASALCRTPSRSRSAELPLQTPSGLQPGIGSPLPPSGSLESPHGESALHETQTDLPLGLLDSFSSGRRAIPETTASGSRRGSSPWAFRYASIGISAFPNTPDWIACASDANDLTIDAADANFSTGMLQELYIPWPLKNKMEAYLFRYFSEFAARWFDLCDGEKSFSYIVPCRAVTYSPLMYALFAISARLLSLTSSFDESIADRYYQRCLHTLRPMLSDEASLVDENLFAATVILRNLEEVEVPLAGAHRNTHLLGNSLFVRASAVLHDTAGPSASVVFSGLRRAAFLVAVRQEIYTAFVSQRSISPFFGPFVIDPSLDVEGTDFDWANRAVFHLADVVRFCYGSDSASQEEKLAAYDHLEKYGKDWFVKKPLSLSPLYSNDARVVPAASTPDTSTSPSESIRGNDSASFFPEIWMMSDAAATGMQHYHLSRILLLAFDPRAPRVGPSRATFVRLQDASIRNEVRFLVGIARSNTPCRPHYVSACMGISVAGERFEERWQQVEVMDFLEETEALCAWPTGTVRELLSESWGWSS